MNMLVSVVMCVYNEEIKYIKQSVDSMLAQTYKNIEIIIVVDNPLYQEAISFLQKNYVVYNNIFIHINPQNFGLPKSLNIGIELAKGDIICRMDSDDISLPQRIEKQIEAMNLYKTDIVTSNAIRIDENDNVLLPSFIYPSKNRDIYNIMKYRNILIHPTFLFKKNIFNAVNGYNENFIYAQDYEFTLKCMRNKYIFHTIQEPLLLYRVRNNSISSSKKTLQIFLAVMAIDMYVKNKKVDNNFMDSIHKNNMYNEFINSFAFYSFGIDMIKKNKFFRGIVNIIIGLLRSVVLQRYIFSGYICKFLLKKYNKIAA